MLAVAMVLKSALALQLVIKEALNRWKVEFQVLASIPMAILLGKVDLKYL
jgi:hypothetical protein